MSLKKFLTNLIKGVSPEPNSRVTEWTLVTDKLPKENEDCEVIIYGADKGRLLRRGIRIVRYIGRGEWDTAYSYDVVIFWRNLPDLPEE